MRKHYKFLGTGFAAALLLTSLTLNSFAAQISDKEAKSIALDYTKVKEDDISRFESKLDSDDGMQIYEIEFFDKNSGEYEFEIKADDGLILRVEYDRKTALPKTTNTANKTISLETAKELAAEHTGWKTDDVTFVKAKTEYDDGRQVHKLEFCTDDYQEYEYKLDVATGTILDYEYDVETHYILLKEKENSNTNNNSKQNPKTDTQEDTKNSAKNTPNNAVDLEGAKALALKKANVKDSQTTWKKLKEDYDDGRLVYEGEFVSGNWEYEFEIDALTGNIIDWDVDSIFD
ncbi:MAG: PepSY domain-containing protein [bacterium]|nr:PepSY domain-containing protein [bacterium]